MTYSDQMTQLTTNPHLMARLDQAARCAPAKTVARRDAALPRWAKTGAWTAELDQVQMASAAMIILLND